MSQWHNKAKLQRARNGDSLPVILTICDGNCSGDFGFSTVDIEGVVSERMHQKLGNESEIRNSRKFFGQASHWASPGLPIGCSKSPFRP
jgi:hypothetical protein